MCLSLPVVPLQVVTTSSSQYLVSYTQHDVVIFDGLFLLISLPIGLTSDSENRNIRLSVATNRGVKV